MLLELKGNFALILPAEISERFILAAGGYGLHLTRKVDVISLPGQPVRRQVLEFGRQSEKPTHSQLIIEYRHHEYTPEFYELTRDFYLESTFRCMKPAR